MITGKSRTSVVSPDAGASVQRYDPVQDGVEKTAHAVRYTIEPPPAHLRGLVHSYWELKTESVLAHDFSLHAMPDACVNILFNQLDPDIAGVTALRTRHITLNLGTSFHYAGIQLLPGVWRGNPSEIADQFVGTPYQGALPLVTVSRELAQHDFPAKRDIMSHLVAWCVDAGFVARNTLVEAILSRLDDIRTVADMAQAARLSPRQLQRSLKQATGFSPHDFLKVLRLQKSFKQHYLDLYADQSHYIHAFRDVTGYTPLRYTEKFRV
jgi:AraC-like DNA-binding protein